LLENSIDAIRSKFARRFPGNTNVKRSDGSLSARSKANKGDIAKEWIRLIGIKGTNALAVEIRQLKEEKLGFLVGVLLLLLRLYL
jgi:hypothetical protein